MACRHGDVGCPWGSRLESAANNTHKIDILVFRPPTTCRDYCCVLTVHSILPIPSYTTFFRPPPHTPIIISRTAIHLLITSRRPSESSLLVQSRSGSMDPLDTPTFRHGPSSVRSRVFFRAVGSRRSISQSFGAVEVVTQSRERPTCMNDRYVDMYCTIRIMLQCVCTTTSPPQLPAIPAFDQRHNFTCTLYRP